MPLHTSNTGCRLLRRMLTERIETHDGFAPPDGHPLAGALRQTVIEMSSLPKIVDDIERDNDEALDWKALKPPFEHLWIESRFGPHAKHCGACIDRVDTFRHPNPEITQAYAAAVFSEHAAYQDTVFMLGSFMLYMNKDGDVIDQASLDARQMQAINPEIADRHHERLERGHMLATGAFMTIARTLHLLTSRNIALHETTDPRGPRKPKAARVPFENAGHRYYVLVLNDSKYRPGGSGNLTGTMPLHVRRGHFAHYGPEYGRGLLFGKYSGRFWVPELDAGDAKNGTIYKDYEIGPDWKPAA